MLNFSKYIYFVIINHLKLNNDAKNRFFALARKEITQLLRNKQLLFLLVFPPTIQLCLYGLILSPDVKNVKLGISDQANILASRELISSLTANNVFVAKYYVNSQEYLGQLVQNGKISAGIYIPPEFSRDLHRDKPANVQIMIDGVDAYTAGIASAYISQILLLYNQKYFTSGTYNPISTQVIFLYNPGLKSSWFFVLGVMGLVMTFICSIASSVESIREKDTGTLEQLLMTPASSFEILLAKILPLFVLLMGTLTISLVVATALFRIPFRGSLLLFLALSAIYITIGISIGLLVGTVSQTKEQAIMIGFFVNLPMVILSGAITPIESMPAFFRYAALLNPLRHYVTIIRGIILKGIGLKILWINVFILIIFAVVLLTISARRYRSQLS
jgi:ABC-2 type transport system permease protein